VVGAADLGVKAPIVPPVPVFSWTGVYLGIGGGTGWGNKEYSWNQDPTVAAIGAQMGGAGPLPTPGATQGSVPISGGFFGGQLGGNWQVEWAVFGIQADAHWADIEGHGSCFDAGVLATAGVSFACNVVSRGQLAPCYEKRPAGELDLCIFQRPAPFSYQFRASGTAALPNELGRLRSTLYWAGRRPLFNGLGGNEPFPRQNKKFRNWDRERPGQPT